MGPLSYREPHPLARLRLGQLLARAARERPVVQLAAHVAGARAARAAFGVGGIAGAAIVVALAVAGAGGGALGTALLGSWLIALTAWVFARLAFRVVAARSGGPPPLSGDIPADVARLEDRRLPVPSERLALAGIALPVVAVTLLSPLTLHLAFWALFMRHPADDMSSFDGWVQVSLTIVGHAHLLLAYLGVRYARQLVAAPLAAYDQLERGWKALGLTVLASCLPGIVLLAIPPLLTAATGALFVPALFATLRRVAASERRAVEEAAAALHRG